MTPEPHETSGDGIDPELPPEVTEEAERLTRLARNAVDPAESAAYRDRRDTLVGEHGFTPRVREADDTLVCYPAEWVEDGTVQFDRLEDTDRAIEVTLSGSGDPDEWEAIEEHNAAVVAAVEAEAGPVHAANARAFADFMGNHYARRVETASEAERREFREEYYPRNVWADETQEAALERSLELVFEIAKEA